MTEKQLILLAEKARNNAYAPYSGFKVGAALLASSGEVYTGCNIENAAYSPTVCAERVAFFKAIEKGERDFTAIAIVGGKETLSDFTAPCGVCRQVMAEFCNSDFKLVLGTPERYRTYAMDEILPFSFGKSDLTEEK